jgi:hypothetical protein
LAVRRSCAAISALISASPAVTSGITVDAV